jgi:hypothetical protein
MKYKNLHEDLLTLCPELLQDDRMTKKKKFSINNKHICLIILIVMLFSGSIFAIEFLQQKKYQLLLINETIVPNNTTTIGCVYSPYFNIYVHPFAILLFFVYSLIFWRRSFMPNLFFGRPAMPMIHSFLLKEKRLLISLVYSIIAFNILPIIENNIIPLSISNAEVDDYSGMIVLLKSTAEVLSVSLRYYPVLVSFTANSTLIYLTSAIYMCIDFIVTIFQTGFIFIRYFFSIFFPFII